MHKCTHASMCTNAHKHTHPHAHAHLQTFTCAHAYILEGNIYYVIYFKVIHCAAMTLSRQSGSVPGVTSREVICCGDVSQLRSLGAMVGSSAEPRPCGNT